jgi:hypothetical protein
MSKDSMTGQKKTKPRRQNHLKLSVHDPPFSIKKIKTQHTIS